MQYVSFYNSPFGKILLAVDAKGIIGLWFEGQKYFGLGLENEYIEKETVIIKEVKQWLDIYFRGEKPDFIPPVHFIGTSFQLLVWDILKSIPYGEVITYNAIAKEIAKLKSIAKMSAQAVGGAVGHNKISIIIPCHRVIGMKGSLTGYAGGIDRKLQLLKLEGVDTEKLFVPKNEQYCNFIL